MLYLLIVVAARSRQRRTLKSAFVPQGRQQEWMTGPLGGSRRHRPMNKGTRVFSLLLPPRGQRLVGPDGERSARARRGPNLNHGIKALALVCPLHPATVRQERASPARSRGVAALHRVDPPASAGTFGRRKKSKGGDAGTTRLGESRRVTSTWRLKPLPLIRGLPRLASPCRRDGKGEAMESHGGLKCYRMERGLPLGLSSA